METWSVDQVCSWLVEKNLGKLVHRFQEEEVSGAALLALNDRMVQQLVKKIGHQAVLMDLIKKYKQQSQGLASPGSSREIALAVQAAVAPEDEQSSSAANHREQTPTFYPAEDLENGLIDQRVLKQRRKVKHVLARNKALPCTKSYVLPEFPYDVRCMFAEHRCPDHSTRIRIIEFLQADMTKYLRGSLYPSTQQYNDVVNALLQAHPFLDEVGCGFVLWKRALKDRFKYVRRSIEDDEQVVFREFQLLTRTDIYKKTRHILESFSEYVPTSFSAVDNLINIVLQEKMKQHAHEDMLKCTSIHTWLEVKNPFNINVCEFSLRLEKDRHKSGQLCHGLGGSESCLSCIRDPVSSVTVPNPQLPGDNDF